MNLVRLSDLKNKKSNIKVGQVCGQYTVDLQWIIYQRWCWNDDGDPRQAHRQNYRNLAIRYPHIALNVIFVYHLDDVDIGHNDVYKHDFWVYPWPDGLVLKLAKYARTLVLSRNSDIIRHLGTVTPPYYITNVTLVNRLLTIVLYTSTGEKNTRKDGIEKIEEAENEADIQFISPIFYMCEKKCDLLTTTLNNGRMYGKHAADPEKRHCMIGHEFEIDKHTR